MSGEFFNTCVDEFKSKLRLNEIHPITTSSQGCDSCISTTLASQSPTSNSICCTNGNNSNRNTTDYIMRMIGPCDNDFTGLKLMISRVKQSEFTAKSIATHLNALAELELAKSKSLKKTISKTESLFRSCPIKSTANSIGECFFAHLDSQKGSTAESHALLAKKLASHAQVLLGEGKRAKKEAKQLKKAADAAISQYESSRSSMMNIRAKYEASSGEMQNFLYTNKPLSPTARLATTEKQAKNYEKTLARLTEKTSRLQQQLNKASQETSQLKEALFARLIPSVLNALIELDLELGDAMQSCLRLVGEDSQALSFTLQAQCQSWKPLIGKMSPAKDLAEHLSKFCLEVASKENFLLPNGACAVHQLPEPLRMLHHEEESSNSKLFGGSTLESLVERREISQPNTWEIFPPPFMRNLIRIIESESKICTLGLYRLSANHSQVLQIQEALEANFSLQQKESCNESSSSSQHQQEQREILSQIQNVHILTTLLKQFIGNLSTPLLPPALFPKARHEVDNASLMAALSLLPMANFVTWQLLAAHLGRVAAASHSNRMNREALAVIWAPVLFHTKAGSGEEGGSGGIEDVALSVKIVEQLLTLSAQT